MDSVIYPKQICPFIFLNSGIDNIYFYNLTLNNTISFIEPKFKFYLNAFISNLQFINSEVKLDGNVLNFEVFRALRSIYFINSTLIGIEDDTFLKLSSLKFILLNLTNFDQFVHHQRDHNWLKHINTGIDIDMSDCFNIFYKNDLIFTSTKALLVLNDLKQNYEYPEDDFCLFKNFPHHRSVFPIIYTKKDLKCS